MSLFQFHNSVRHLEKQSQPVSGRNKHFFFGCKFVGVAPKDFIAATVVVPWLPAEAIHWTHSNIFSQYESFTHRNM